ncbi:MAG: hypothetical protein ACOYWZ_06545 [Bacillota bacterium]
MNNVYFKCKDCMEYIDAGYRWSYCLLVQTGIIEDESEINVQKVLDYKPYWDGMLEGEWLANLLPKVEMFLNKHKSHKVLYTELDSLYDNNEWLELLAICDKDNYTEITPRYFAETMGYEKWEQVIEHISKMDASPVWFDDYENMKERAKNKFDYFVKRKKG